MINPTVWSTGPVTITDTGLADVDTWYLINPATDAVIASGGVDSATATQVVFTPAGVPANVYTVSLSDSANVEILRYPSSLAVVTMTPPDIPNGITLEWIDAWGAIRFTAGGMGPGQTVKLIGPGNVLVPIRSYETADWHNGTDDGYGYAFEMPLGVMVRFGICGVADTTWQGGQEKSIFTPTGRAWLRDLHNPLLSLEVAVSSTGDEQREARQALHRIAGRPKPIVRWDVRGGRQGTITLRVENGPKQLAWATTFRNRLDRLLETGRPLLLSLCADHGFDPCYMAVGTYRVRRLGLNARWAVDLDYVEVDNPTSVDVLLPTEVTYEQARQLPPSATYADWATVRYLDVATRTTV